MNITQEMVFVIHGLVALLCLIYISTRWQSLWLWGLTVLFGVTMVGIGWAAIDGTITWRLARILMRLASPTAGTITVGVWMYILTIEEHRAFAALNRSEDEITKIRLMNEVGRSGQSFLKRRFNMVTVYACVILYFNSILGW